MTRYVFKMPDLGEGTVEAEIVAWHVKVGDHITEDQVMAEVMTEKAAVEVPAPVTGRVVSLAGGPGDMVRVGAELVVFDTEGGEGFAEPAPVAAPAPSPAAVEKGRGEGMPAVPQARASHGLSCVAAPRARSGHRPGAGAGQRSARPHHPAGSRCSSERRGAGSARRSRRRSARRSAWPNAAAPRRSRSSACAASSRTA